MQEKVEWGGGNEGGSSTFYKQSIYIHTSLPTCTCRWQTHVFWPGHSGLA